MINLDVLMTFNVDPDGQGDIIFTDSWEEGTEVNQPVNTVSHNNLLKVLEVQNVGEYERTWKNSQLSNLFSFQTELDAVCACRTVDLNATGIDLWSPFKPIW